MKQGLVETLVGFGVLLLAAWFFMFAFNASNASKGSSGYLVSASFENIDGINSGADVKIAGIKIGHVEDISLDSEGYSAIVNMRISQDVKIPSDSRVIVSTSGLLGGKYMRINLGGSEDNLSEGGKLMFTQSSLNIEDIISKIMYSLTSK